jgi:hypothetical protein
VEHRLAALARLHRELELPSPTDHPKVRAAVRLAANAYATRGVHAQPACVVGALANLTRGQR